MKKFMLLLFALILLPLSAQAYNYNNNCPSNAFGGQSLFPKTPKINGSAQAYQDRINASRNRERYEVNHYYIDSDGNRRKKTLREQHREYEQSKESK